MRIVVDLQGAQTESRFRGIGRYALSLTREIARRNRGHEILVMGNEALPVSAEDLHRELQGTVPLGNIKMFSVPAPVAWRSDANAWRRGAAELARESFIHQLRPDAVLVTSLFEGAQDDAVLSIGRLHDAGFPTLAVLYDLIPLLNPEKYLGARWVHDWYFRAIEHLQRADLLLSISEHSKEEAHEALKLARDRIATISSACDESFHVISLTPEQIKALRESHGLAGAFVLCTGAMDERKNITRLVHAYAALPPELIARYQLALAGKWHPQEESLIAELAGSLGVAGRVVVLQHVSDEALVQLLNAATLFVFPSMQEGFGLPPLEAMACGTATIASRATSLPEVIGLEEAMFDPTDVAEMTALMGRALSDNEFRQRLEAHGLERAAQFSWARSADITLDCIESIASPRSASGSAIPQTPHEARHALLTAVDALTTAALKPSSRDLRQLAAAVAQNESVASGSSHGHAPAAQEPSDVQGATDRSGRPRLALDMYVLTQGVKTGIYRVCQELYPRLAACDSLDVSLFYRTPSEQSFGIPARAYVATDMQHGHAADILLSPFGEAPQDWLQDPHVLQAHFIYDLIAIEHPEYFNEAASQEVRRIIDSLDDRTVVFAISENTRQDLLKHRPDLDPAQVVVIPLAAGDGFLECHDQDRRAEVRRKYGIPQGVPYVLSLATLEIRKNLEGTVRAFCRHLDAKPESQLHLVLSGMPGWKLEEFNAALESSAQWQHRIVLTGFVDDEDLSPLYSDALCFIYLSRYEGFGLPPLEAMACGTPVICSDNSSLPEVVGDAGILVGSDDVDGAAKALARICENQDLRHALSARGLERAKQFSWDRSAQAVARSLIAAWTRFSALPPPHSRHLQSGKLARRYLGPDGGLRANFLFYANGALGPRFPEMRAQAPASPSLGHRQPWPNWTDALPPGEAKRIEGGLRSQGQLKNTSAELPLVSYITVVRNNEALLARTIESVQAQTYPNVEHIVLDGASTDGTLDVILRYADRIDYFASEPDKGLYQAINKALPLARGELICILNSDDWLDARAAEIAVQRCVGTGKATLLLSGAIARGNGTSVDWAPSFVHPGCYFICANDCHNAIYATRAAYEASGPYDESFRIAADFKWIMTCVDAGVNMVYTRQTTVNYSMGGTSGDVRKHSEECMRVVAERFPFLSQTEVEGLYQCFFFGPVAGIGQLEEDKGRFVQDLFVRYSEHQDFACALTWAAMHKLVGATGSLPQASEIAAPEVSETIQPSLKGLLKAKLARHPAAYRFARSVYSAARRI